MAGTEIRLVPIPRRRWYRPTPDRLILLLLLVEALLLLSAHFRWFPFNEHKGYTVLLTVALVSVSLLLMLFWLALALLFRLRFQFSLRSLLVLVVAVAVPCSWLAVEMKKAREQKEAVEAIYELKGRVFLDYEFAGWVLPPDPAWLRTLLGETFLSDVVLVALRGTEVTDDRLEALERFTQLKWLDLQDAHITDAGLTHLRPCTHLQGLFLRHTRITDDGLDHLFGLTELRDIFLNGTQVTDEGVRRLQRALPRCSVNGHTVE